MHLELIIGDHIREAISERWVIESAILLFQLEVRVERKVQSVDPTKGNMVVSQTGSVHQIEENDHLSVEPVTKFFPGCGHAGQSIASEPGVRALTLPAMWAPPPRRTCLK